MAHIVLQPARHRDGKFSSDKRAEPLGFDAKGLLGRLLLNPKEEPLDRVRIQHIVPGAWVGLVKARSDGRPVCFVLRNDGGVGDYSWVVAKDMTFEERILEVFRVLSVRWDGKLEEMAA